MREDLYLKDFIDRDGLCALQLRRMRETLQRVYQRVPFYQAAFDRAGVKPNDLRTLADLQHFPFTVKTDLRDHYPYGLFATDLSEVVRIHASSGTTGKPIVVGYTRRGHRYLVRGHGPHLPLHRLSPVRMWCRMPIGYGLFTGGLGAHYGLERVGCTVIPMSGGQTEKTTDGDPRLRRHRHLQHPVLFHPSHRGGGQGRVLHQRHPSCARASSAPEPWSEEMRRRIQAEAGISAFDIYGLVRSHRPRRLQRL